MSISVVIPARMGSTRLPGKPFIEIAGVPMVMRTWQRCIEVAAPSRTWVATDDERIADVCTAHGAQVVMTSPDCLTGTDRVAEAARSIDADTYVSIQGDEPLFPARDLTKLIKAALDHPDRIINGYARCTHPRQVLSPAVPKVVMRNDNRLLYASRRSIPGSKTAEPQQAHRQVGAYAFPAAALHAFAAHGRKTALEKLEDIEILRCLELGYDVHMLAMSGDSIAVDTAEDVRRVEVILRA